MIKLVSLFILTFFLSACSVTETEPTIPEGNYTRGVYELTFKTQIISNNHVGNDWSFVYTYDGHTIKSGHQIVYASELFTFMPIHVEIREDDKIDDVGNGTLRVAICDGGSGKTEITVMETDGRYKGNAAVWEVSCEVKLVDNP